MTLNVTGSTSPSWPDHTAAAAPAPPPAGHPAATLPAAPAPAAARPAPHLHPGAMPPPYSDALRLQAFRRDATTITTQSAPETAIASTANAPAVKDGPAAQINLLAVQPQAPARMPPPPVAPAVTAIAELDEQAGARGR